MYTATHDAGIVHDTVSRYYDMNSIQHMANPTVATNVGYNQCAKAKIKYIDSQLKDECIYLIIAVVSTHFNPMVLHTRSCMF